MRATFQIEPSGTVEPCPPIRSVQALDAHPGAGFGRMNEAPVADVHADVRIGLRAGVVEDEVAWREVGALYRRAELALRLRGTRDGQPRPLRERVRDEAAAIEAGFGRAAAKAVARSEGPQRVRKGAFTRRSGRGSRRSERWQGQ